MNKSNYSREYAINYIEEFIIDEYESEVLNNENIAKIREELRKPIKLCEENNIDIHDLFPIIIESDESDESIEVKVYQNGEVYMHEGNNVIYMHKSYEE